MDELLTLQTGKTCTTYSHKGIHVSLFRCRGVPNYLAKLVPERDNCAFSESILDLPSCLNLENCSEVRGCLSHTSSMHNARLKHSITEEQGKRMIKH